jgi:hypothetical protein
MEELLAQMAKDNDRYEEYEEAIKSIKEKLDHSSIVNESVKNKFLMYLGFNSQYRCSNELLTAFGLSGKYNAFGKRNKSRLFCPVNNYTCCSDSQISNSMKQFGHGAVNLKKNLEPIIELAVAFKTEKFINHTIAQLNNPVCSVILDRGFNIKTSSQDFNTKKFFTRINM